MHRSTRRQFVDGVATGLIARQTKGRVRRHAPEGCRLRCVPDSRSAPRCNSRRAVVTRQGARLSDLWRIRQFENAWLRTLSHRYADFWRVTEDALLFASNALATDLTDENRRRLMV